MERKKVTSYLQWAKNGAIFIFFFLTPLALATFLLNKFVGLSLLFLYPLFLFSLFFFQVGGIIGAVISFFGFFVSLLFLTSFKLTLSLFLFTGFCLIFYLFLGLLLGRYFKWQKDIFSEIEQYRLHTTLSALYTGEYLANLIHRHIKEYERYKSEFSIVLLEIEEDVLKNLSRIKREKILTEIGSRLRKGIRAIDEIGRYKNQYLLILPHTPLNGSKVVEKRIKNLIIKTLQENGCQIEREELIYSINVAYPENKEGLEKLLKSLEHPFKA